MACSWNWKMAPAIFCRASIRFWSSPPNASRSRSLLESEAPSPSTVTLTCIWKQAFFVADLLEVQVKGSDSAFRWDMQDWYGGDYDRIWFKSEGEQSTAKPERNIAFQLRYGRFIRRYYDLQIGAGAETRTVRGAS